MPIYEYECESCSHVVEAIQKVTAKPLRKCPECGGKLERLISSPAIQFKGTGWYITDYARKDQKEKASSESNKKDSSKDSSTSKASDSSDSSKSASKKKKTSSK